jgi:hypothetical protein
MQKQGDFAQMPDMSKAKLATLQVGYNRNKAGYKWNEVDDQLPLFLAAQQIWAKECEGQAPKKRDYPIVLSPAVTVEEAMGDATAEEAVEAPAPKKAKKAV